MEIKDNSINQVRLENEQEYFEMVLSLEDYFDDLSSFEEHFEIDTPEQDSKDFNEGIILIDTMKYKPKKYPCTYVFCPIEVVDWGTTSSYCDDFIY